MGLSDETFPTGTLNIDRPNVNHTLVQHCGSLTPYGWKRNPYGVAAEGAYHVMSTIADRTPGGDTRPYCRPSGHPADILTAAELNRLFAALAADYAAAIVLSAGLGFRDRWRVLRLRLDAYNTALRLALDTAKDDATVLLRGERARGGVR